MLGTIIEDQFIAVFNWPLGAALSFILLAIVLLILAVASPLLRRQLGRWHDPALARRADAYLGLVLAFLYLPILVMIADGIQRLAALPAAVRLDHDWFEALASNERLLAASWQQRLDRCPIP